MIANARTCIGALLLLLVAAAPQRANAQIVQQSDGVGTMNLVINYRYPPLQSEVTALQEHVRMASRIICDVTEGQVRIGEVTVTAGSKKEDEADVWIMSEGGRAFVTGVGWDEPNPRRPGFGTREDPNNPGQRIKTDRVHLWGDTLPGKGGGVLAHELMHYAFGVKDQYGDSSSNGSACGFGYGFDGAVSESSTSLMQNDPGPACQTPGTTAGTWVDTGTKCLSADAFCGAGNRCYVTNASELSFGTVGAGGTFTGNHDQINGLGDVNDCPAPRGTQSLNLGTISLNEAAPINATSLSGMTFAQAEAASLAFGKTEAMDALGNIGDDLFPGPSYFDIWVYLQHIAANRWRVSYGMDGAKLNTGATGLVILGNTEFNATPPVRGCGDGLIDTAAGEECEPGDVNACFLTWVNSTPGGVPTVTDVPSGETPCNPTKCTWDRSACTWNAGICTGNGGSLADPGGRLPENCDPTANRTCDNFFPGLGLTGTVGCTRCINDPARCVSPAVGSPGAATFPGGVNINVRNLKTGSADLTIAVAATINFTIDNARLGSPFTDGQRGDCKLYWRDFSTQPWTHDWCGKSFLAGADSGFKSTMQSIMLQESDWTTLTTNYPWLQPPTGGTIAEQAACHRTPVIDVQLNTELQAAEQVFLIIDASGSMGTEDALTSVLTTVKWRSRLAAAQDAASNFVRFQEGADAGEAPEIAVMSFSDTPSCFPGDCSFRNSSVLATRDAMTNDIAAMMPTNQTGLGDALQLACDEFTAIAGNGKTKAVYLLSDGYHNFGTKTPEEAFACLDALGVKVIAIQVGDDADEALLQRISNESGGYMSYAQSGAELDGLYHEAAARGHGDGLIAPRRTSVVIDPTLEGGGAAEENTTFDVTSGSSNLVVHFSALHPGWNPNLEIRSPTGQLWTKTGSTVTSGMTFKLGSYIHLRVPAPALGTWSVKVKYVSSELRVHASNVTISEHNKEVDCFVDVLKRVGGASDKIVVKAGATFHGPLDARSVEFSGQIRGPDLSQQLTFTPNAGGTATALVDPHGVRGSYTVDVRCKVNGATARFQPGQLNHGTADFATTAANFTRSRSVTFFMNTQIHRTCTNNDCDFDGIDNATEGAPTRDSDGDGDPDHRDRDSDNDDFTDDLDPEPTNPGVPNPRAPSPACVANPTPLACCVAGQQVHEGTLFPDILFASFPPDPDCLFGYQSSDILLASPGKDFAAGGDQPDIIFGSAGDDKLLGGASNDLIFAGSGTNYVDGGSGNDLVIDFLSRGDSLLAQDGNDVVLAGNRNDQLRGGSGADVLVGNAGNDLIRPGPGLDAVFGGFGDDRVEILHACEYQLGKALLGGPGDDTLVLPTTRAAAQAAGVLISGFERVIENATGNASLSECAP